MTDQQRYITKLIRAWAAGADDPVRPPRGLDLIPVRERLCAHNVEAALSPYMPHDTQDDEFTAKIAESRARTDFLLLECERILPVLETDSCQPVLLKGVALALTVYRQPRYRQPRHRQPSDRWFLDLDILVPPNEVEAACQRLETLGYRPLQGGRDPLFYEKYHLHRIMLGPQGAVVELHWDMTIPGSVYRHSANGVAKRAIKGQLGRLEVLCASPVDQILHGVYQNIADGFVDVRRVLDSSLLFAGLSEAEWTFLVAEAQKTGMGPGLWMSLHMVKSLGGGSAPYRVMMLLQPGKLTRRVFLGLEVDLGCLDRRAVSTDGYVQMLHLLATPSVRDRWVEVVRLLWVGEGALLDMGHRPDQLPGLVQRSLIGLRRFKTLLIVSWRLARAIV